MATAEKIKERVYQIALSLSMLISSASFGWAWDTNAEMAVIKSNQLQDKSSRDTADDVLKEWSSIISTQESHTRQLQNLWGKMNIAQDKEEAALQRLTRIEVQQEICCE